MEIQNLTANHILFGFITLFISVACLMYFAIKTDLELEKKQKSIIDSLADRTYQVKTKKEIEEFFKEFKVEADKRQSMPNRIRLAKLEGYLNGLYNSIL